MASLFWYSAMNPIQDWASKYRDDPDGMRARVRNVQDFLDFHGITLEYLLAESEKAKPGRPPIAIKNMIVNYLHHLQEAGYAEGTVLLAFRHIRHFLMWNYLYLSPSIWKDNANNSYEDTSEEKLTQARVMRMVKAAELLWPKKPQHKALIAFLAQTGQRQGIATAIKWDHIHVTKNRSHAIVKVVNPYPNRRGINQNKIRSQFRFVIGPQALKLISDLPKQEGGWIFKISDRQITRVVEETADKIGIQDIIKRRKKFSGKEGEWHKIHPHTFRGYWEGQMRKSRADRDVVNYMMGHKMPYGGTYTRFSDKELLENYRKAEQKLAVWHELASAEA
jgi:integrase